MIALVNYLLGKLCLIFSHITMCQSKKRVNYLYVTMKLQNELKQKKNTHKIIVKIEFLA